MPPAALDALLARAAIRDRKQLFPGALVCATLCNLHNDWDKRPQGWKPDDFLPGAVREIDSDLIAFAREVEAGQVQSPTPEQAAEFRARLARDIKLHPASSTAPTENRPE